MCVHEHMCMHVIYAFISICIIDCLYFISFIIFQNLILFLFLKNFLGEVFNKSCITCKIVYFIPLIIFLLELHCVTSNFIPYYCGQTSVRKSKVFIFNILTPLMFNGTCVSCQSRLCPPDFFLLFRCLQVSTCYPFEVCRVICACKIHNC